MREGSGSYFYAESGKVFVGEWANDLPKVGNRTCQTAGWGRANRKNQRQAGVYTQANSNPEQATFGELRVPG